MYLRRARRWKWDAGARLRGSDALMLLAGRRRVDRGMGRGGAGQQLQRQRPRTALFSPSRGPWWRRRSAAQEAEVGHSWASGGSDVLRRRPKGSVAKDHRSDGAAALPLYLFRWRGCSYARLCPTARRWPWSRRSSRGSSLVSSPTLPRPSKHPSTCPCTIWTGAGLPVGCIAGRPLSVCALAPRPP